MSRQGLLAIDSGVTIKGLLGIGSVVAIGNRVIVQIMTSLLSDSSPYRGPNILSEWDRCRYEIERVEGPSVGRRAGDQRAEHRRLPAFSGSSRDSNDLRFGTGADAGVSVAIL